MLSVLIWILAITGTIAIVVYTADLVDITSAETMIPIIGAFLLCMGYTGVEYSDKAEES